MSRNTTKIYISYKTQCQLKTNFDIIVVNNKLILFKKRKKKYHENIFKFGYSIENYDSIRNKKQITHYKQTYRY